MNRSKIFFPLAGGLAALLVLAVPALAADNTVITDRNGSAVTMGDKDVGSVHYSQVTPVDIGATTMTETTNHSLKVTPQATEVVLGKVVGQAATPTATFTSVAGTTPYTIGDLIANSGTAGSVVTWELTTACRVNGGVGTIPRISVNTVDTGFNAGTAIIFVYAFVGAAQPTPGVGDNAAFIAPKAGFVGGFSVVLDNIWSDGYQGHGVPLKGSSLTYTCDATNKSLYLFAVAGTGNTPQGSKAWAIQADVFYQN